MRKLIILALGGAAVAYVLKNRGGQAASPAPAATDYAPSPAGAPAEDVTPDAPVAPPVDTTADTVETDAVIPDTSADDPTVQEQEDAAAAEAADIGGDAGTVTEDVDPEMRPVVEGSGDAEETFEQTEDEGR